MKHLIVFHGADIDGHMSAYIVYDYIKRNSTDITTIDLYPWFYNETLHDISQNYDMYYFVDVSVDINSLKTYLSDKEFIYIDHHLHTEVPKLPLYEENIIIDHDYSAAYLAYLYFHKNNDVPKTISLISNYDIWKHDKDRTDIYFNYFTNSNNFDVTTENGREFLHNLLYDKDFLPNTNAIFIGQNIEKYVANHIHKRAKNKSFEFKYNGYKVLAVNSFIRSSLVLDPYDNILGDTYDIFFVFVFNPNGYFDCSFYSKGNVNVQKIASDYGGGGHKNAAGCSMSIQQLLDFIGGES